MPNGRRLRCGREARPKSPTPQRCAPRHQRHALYHDDGSSGFTSEGNLFSEGSSVLIKPGYNRLNRSGVLQCGQDGRYLPEEPGWCYAQYLTHAEVRLRKGGRGGHDAMDGAMHDARCDA